MDNTLLIFNSIKIINFSKNIPLHFRVSYVDLVLIILILLNLFYKENDEIFKILIVSAFVYNIF